MSCAGFVLGRDEAEGDASVSPSLFVFLEAPIKPSSAKAKGRTFQQAIRDDLRKLAAPYGLEDADCESRGMGQNGEDIILSPAYRRLLNLDIECKSVQKLVVPTTFFEHYGKYKAKPSLKLLTHKRNRQEPLVTLLWTDFLNLIRRTLPDVTGKE
jgi:hypothetical protein